MAKCSRARKLKGELLLIFPPRGMHALDCTGLLLRHLGTGHPHSSAALIARRHHYPTCPFRGIVGGVGVLRCLGACDSAWLQERKRERVTAGAAAYRVGFTLVAFRSNESAGAALAAARHILAGQALDVSGDFWRATNAALAEPVDALAICGAAQARWCLAHPLCVWSVPVRSAKRGESALSAKFLCACAHEREHARARTGAGLREHPQQCPIAVCMRGNTLRQNCSSVGDKRSSKGEGSLHSPP